MSSIVFLFKLIIAEEMIKLLQGVGMSRVKSGQAVEALITEHGIDSLTLLKLKAESKELNPILTNVASIDPKFLEKIQSEALAVPT